MQGLILPLGRILLALPFLALGAMHFMQADGMAGMVPIPGGVFWVYLTGATSLGAAAALLIGKQLRIVGILIALQMIIFALSIHLPGLMGATDQMAQAGFMSGLLKDLGLAGGGLLVSWIYRDK